MRKSPSPQSYTVTQVAAICQRDPSRIRQILGKHPELGSKHGRDWAISPANLQGIQKLLKNLSKSSDSR